MNTPPDVRRAAMFLAVASCPFTRWRELTGKEQDEFIRKARRIRTHLKEHEPLSQI